MSGIRRQQQSRPIPAGRVAPNIALGFGISLAVASVSMMSLAVNGFAAGLLSRAATRRASSSSGV